MRLSILINKILLIALTVAAVTGCKSTDTSQVDSLLNGSITQPSSNPVQLLASSSASYGQVGVCVGPISVSTVTASLQPAVTKTTVNVNVAVNGSGSYYVDSSCVSPTNSLTIPAGASTANVYFKGNESGFGMLYFSAAGFISGMMPFNVISGAPASVGLNGPITVGQGNCSAPFTLTLYDANGFTATASSNVSISLSGAGSGNFYADANCSSAVTQVTIASGSSTKYFYVKDNVGEALSLAASSSGLGGATSPLTVTSGATATKLLLSAQQPYAAAGSCYGPITVTTADNSGTPISVPSTLAANLALNGAGSFYSDSGCSTQVTSVSIPSGTSSANFYYKGTLVQSYSMFATSSGLAGGSMAFTLIAGAPAAITLSGPASVSGGACSSGFTATLVDAYGNTAIASSPTTINLGGGGSGAFYADSSCGSAVTSVAVAAGTSIKAFYFKDNISESLTLTTGATGLTGGSALLAVSSTAGATRLTLAAQQPYSTAGNCFGPITVTLADSNGTPVNAALATPVSFTSNGTGAFFSNAACTTGASSATISSGNSTAQIYYKGSVTESYTLFASATGLTGGSLPLTMIADAPASLTLNGPTSVNKGSCSSAFTMSLLDTYGNTAKAASNLTVNLSGAGAGAFYSDSSCSSAVTSVTIGSGTSTKTFYLKDSTAESLTLSASPTGIPSATSSVTVLAGATPTKLLVSAQQLYGTAGDCFGPITVTSADSAGASVNVNSDTTVTLTTNGVGAFYSNAVCSAQSSTATITSGSNSASVYYKGTAVQTGTLFASAPSLTGGSMPFTVVAAAPAALSVTGTASFGGGSCSPAFTVTLLDAYGNTARATSTVTVNLSGGGSGTFYTGSTCAGGAATTSTTIGATSSSATFYFKDPTGESLTLTAADAAAALTSGTMSITVTAGSTPTKLTLSAAGALTSTGVCYGPISISSTDLSGTAIAVASDTTVTLGGNSLGSFYSDGTCGSAVTTRTLTAGSSVTTVFFKDNLAETLSFTASATGLSSGLLPFTVSAGSPAKITVAGTGSLSASTCSGAFTVTLQDTFNNTAKSSGATTVNLSGGGAGTFYSDASCSTTATSVSIANGASTAAFYFKDGTAEALTLAAGATGLSSGSIALTVTSGTPAQLVVSAPSSVAAGLCSNAFTVYSRDASGNNANVPSNKTVNLSGQGTGSFYSDSGCVTPVAAVVINSGANSTSFWFKDTKAETLTVGTASSGLISSSVSYTVTPNALIKLVVTLTSGSVNAHACAPAIAVTAADVYSNPFTLVSDITATLSDGSAGGVFYDDGACTSGHEITSVTLTAGISSKNVYYANATAGSVTLTAAKAGLTSGTAALTVVGLTASKLAISGPTALTTNGCSSPFTVTSRDAFDAVTPVTSTTTIALDGGANGQGVFYSNSACTLPITSLTFASGTSTGTFYYKNVVGQSLTLTASASGLASGTIAITHSAILSALEIMASGWYVSGSSDGTGTGARFAGPYGAVPDGSGNVYVTDTTAIRKIVPSTGVVTTVVGKLNPILPSITDGPVSTATIVAARGITKIGTDIYFVDNHSVRRWDMAGGTVAIIAGSGSVAGTTNGVGTSARFSSPGGLTTDGTNIFVADASNNCIRKIAITAGPTYTVTTIAGSCGAANAGTDSTTDATLVRFHGPNHAVYLGGYIYVSDNGGATIRKVEVATGYTTTLAGTYASTGNTEGTGAAARFNTPTGITTDGVNLYVGETNNYNIRKVTTAGVVTSIAGSYTAGWGDGYAQASGVKFYFPVGLTYDSSANALYVAELGNYALRKIDFSNSNSVSTIAGAPGSMLTKRVPYSLSSADGIGNAAGVHNAYGAVEVNGILYFTETGYHTLRSLNIKTQQVTTLAGLANTSGSTNGYGAAARFNAPAGLVADSTGAYLYIADQSNHCIRRYEIATTLVSTFSGTCGSSGNTDSTTATSVKYNGPRDMVIDSTGTWMYVTENGAHRIRKVYFSGVNAGGAIMWVGDSAGTSGNVNGALTAARFNAPCGLVMDSDGTYLYTVEATGQILRRIQISDGSVTTLAGLYNTAAYVDNATGSVARFNGANGLTISPDGTALYIADATNAAVRKYTISSGAVSSFIGIPIGTSYKGVTGEVDDGSFSTISNIRNVLYTNTGLWLIQGQAIKLVH
jgi:hypothetical protein